MPVLRLSGFLGENRAVHPMLLPEGVGTASRNQKPGRGDLRPWKNPNTVATVPAGRATLYRMGRDVASDTQYWLSWTGTVHAVRGFDASDTTERTYYTGDGAPKVTDNTLALTSPPYPTANRPLGLPAPATAPTVAVASAGTADTELVSIYYVYTYVNDWGWESAPSPVSALLERRADGTTTISNFASVPAGNYQVNRIRVYRTQTGASGATEFFFLREVAYGTASTTDDNRALGETLASTTWLAPPADLSWLTALWNGMLAGISGNAVRFCEAYVPYAWPVAYDVVPPDAKPVALGVFGQSLLVLTTGRPVLVSGSTPEAMDQQLLDIPQGCVAPKSVVSMGSGVAWASEDGLCWHGAGGARVLTAGLMTREDWQVLAPSTITGEHYEGLYFGSFDDGGGRKGFLIDPANPTGIYFLDTGYATTHFDELRDQLYVLASTSVQKWDVAATSMTCRFRSKVHRLPRPTGFACGELIADSYPVTLRVDAVGVDAATVTKLTTLKPAVYTSPSATTLRHTVTVGSRAPFRLPSDYLALDWQLEIEGTAAVQGVVLATSIHELAAE
jgi:hypothetical protein